MRPGPWAVYSVCRERSRELATIGTRIASMLYTMLTSVSIRLVEELVWMAAKAFEQKQFVDESSQGTISI